MLAGDERTYPLIKNDSLLDDKKVKSIRCTASIKDSVKVGDSFGLYEVVKFDNFASTRFINNFNVESVNDKGSDLKLTFFGSKRKLAEALREGKDNEFIVATTTAAIKNYNQKLNNITEMQTVGVRKTCMFCSPALEKSLMAVPTVKLVERNVPVLQYFRDLAKLDKFMDVANGDEQFKQLGVRYLFYKDGSKLQSTDIETGRILGSETAETRFLGLTLDNSNSPMTAKSLFMETFNKEMQIIKYTEETKNKIKEILLSSQFGILPGESFKIFIEETEDVNGKQVKRNVQIGEGFVAKTLSDMVGIMKVKDGEKEFFKARAEGKKVVIKYRLTKN
jgi:hypothetical protein